MTFMNRRRGMLCSAAFVALAAAAPAFAAEEAPAPAPAEGEVTEVIITATRRAEALQDVPLAVTALSGERMEQERIQNFTDIPALVPGATFVSTKGPSTANVQIRGQQTTNDSPHLELPVAVFMDDVYYGTLASFSADFFDIDQLAILRGPQGTTFGRNVVGGALQITSKRPQIGVTDGELNLGLSKYDTARDAGFEARGYFNAALGDTVSARLAYSLKDIGGYSKNRTTGTYLNDQNSWALRPSVRFQPNADLDILLQAYVFHEDQYPTGYKSVGQGSVVAANKAAEDNPWDVFHNDDGEYRRDIYLVQGRVDYQTPIGELTSITSYRNLDSYYADDGDSGPRPMSIDSLNQSREFQFSQEVRLTSPSAQRFRYVVGGYYSFENIYKLIHFGFNGTVPGSRLGAMHCGSPAAAGYIGCPVAPTPYGPTNYGPLFEQSVFGSSHVKSYAAFAEVEYDILDTLTLTVGGRYTILDKAGYTTHDGFSLFYGNPFAVKFDDKWEAFTPRVILDWRPTDDLMFYASYSTGFKGGGWSLTSTTAAKAVIPLEPEDSVSYELGAKTQFFDNRVTFNVALYQADTENLQVRSLIAGVLNDTNAGVLRVKGVEVEASVTPIDGLTLGVNYAYTDAYFKEFKGCAAGGIDCTGNAAPFVPEHDVTLYGSYGIDLSDGSRVTLKADAKWASKFPVGPLANQPYAEDLTGKEGILNASMLWESPDDVWAVQLWGKNLTNEWSYTAAANYFFYFLTQAEFNAGAREVDRGSINPPRQVGITLTRKFN